MNKVAQSPCTAGPDGRTEAGLRLLETYSGLAARGEHLLDTMLAGGAPRQWAHYPAQDAIDRSGGYQWFYHSHSPEDRPMGAEHGHLHLFARRPLWSRRMRTRRERDFAALCGNPPSSPGTRHLVAIGFDPKGVPVSLFTVNSWVTGDLMLSAALTLELLRSMSLDTGHPEIDVVVASLVRLYEDELGELMARRDELLRSRIFPLRDHTLEVLSELRIRVDEKLMV